ncbi:winged helix-turn-helix transcriptional regulator [Allokutzneria oryzae]|uniref:Winged helix-turn-helix transcriptional regulator n=1 Tax=Allokutzneria oryzae TaxID=1378989 RepID=A0ABV5ZUR1_9PSEU
MVGTHGTSKAGLSVGHQAETDGRVWDGELVPDTRGRTSRPEPDCPVEVALAAVSGRWATLVLRELMHGPCSFGELRARLPTLTAKVLTERLGELLDQGLVAKDRLPGFPVRTSYRLTEAGLELRPLLVALYDTGSRVLAALPPHD